MSICFVDYINEHDNLKSNEHVTVYVIYGNISKFKFNK